MQGFRTILVAIVGPFVLWGAKKLLALGFSLTPDQEQTLQDWLVGGGMTVAMIVMRFLTSTPIFQKVISEFSTTGTPATTTTKSATSTTAKVLAATLFVGLLVSSYGLGGCTFLQKLTTPAAQPYITAAVDVAVTTAEQKGVTAAKINQLAKAALVAASSSSATLATVSAAVNAEFTKLKLPAGDIAAAQILEDALTVAIQAQIAGSAKAGTAIATFQAAATDVLNAVIAATGG
jgi:hypothetical protein